MTVTAHTGALGSVNNSLESVKICAESGADIIEIDLNFDENGTPVLSHNKPKGGEALFEDALIIFKPYESIRMNIDVKSTSHLYKVQELVKKHGLLDRVFFTGVYESWTKTVKEQCPEIPYYLNLLGFQKLFCKSKHYEKVADRIKKCGAIGLNANRDFISKEMVDYLHGENLLVSGWTAKTVKHIESLKAKGVDNITTLRPDLFREN